MIDVSNIKNVNVKDRVVDAVKKMELEILEEVDRICRKNCIDYSISGIPRSGLTERCFATGFWFLQT